MAIKHIYLRGGSTAEHETFIGKDREVTVDTDKKTLVVHDGVTAGGIPQAKAENVPTKLSDLIDDLNLWKKTDLAKVSQLTDDVGYWGNLTKVSQLTNDLGFKTAHCSYCSYCSYYSQCSRCNSVHCSQRTVDCTYIDCSLCYHCSGDNCSNCNFPEYRNCLANHCTDFECTDDDGA